MPIFPALKRPLKGSHPEILGAYSIGYSSECRARARISVSRTFSADLRSVFRLGKFLSEDRASREISSRSVDRYF